MDDSNKVDAILYLFVRNYSMKNKQVVGSLMSISALNDDELNIMIANCH